MVPIQTVLEAILQQNLVSCSVFTPLLLLVFPSGQEAITVI
jgi:hypothetical protein